MKRNVYVGGFGNGLASAESVGEALEDLTDRVTDVFTFSEAMKNKDSIRRAAKGAQAFTHSAGMMPIYVAKPEQLHAFNAPIPTSKKALVAKTFAKTARMHTPGISIHSLDDLAAIGRYDLSSVEELTKHPVGNVKHLGKIAAYDAFFMAQVTKSVDIDVTLAYSDKDSYFKVGELERAIAENSDIPLYEFAGQHDELVLHPHRVLEDYLTAAA